MKEYTGLEIAIIGLAGKFPGADDIYSFWENIKQKEESIHFFSEEELLENGETIENIKHPNYVNANAHMSNRNFFDAEFFNIRPDEAQLMDPQMRLFHEYLWKALEDAGIDLHDQKHKIGLFAGASANTNWVIYSQLLNRKGLVDDFTLSKLNNARFIPTKASYFFDLTGPSIFLDTACSTSLVAIHEACKSLLLSDCNIAVAGGVSVGAKTTRGYVYQEGMVFSKDGHCRAFDAEASGTIGGEGIGLVVLKTLKKALEDGDHIWSIIKGCGVNNDGNHKVGYTAPSIEGQVEAILKAQKWAKVKPESITLLEAHGTGTKLGDPIEVEALNKVFGGAELGKYCALGSVKTNIGHLDVAAGAAGVIKTALALKHRQLPPSLNFEQPNPEIDFENSPFYVNTGLREWHHAQFPLRAGVSSFGIGGTNAHIVIEEAPDQPPTDQGRSSQLLVLSAKSPTALHRNMHNLASFLTSREELNLADVAYTLQKGRTRLPYSATVVCQDREDAILKLQRRTVASHSGDAMREPIIFMFSGQGSQYVNMCKDLYEEETFFRKTVDACFDYIRQTMGWDAKTIWLADKTAEQINETVYTQPILFSIEYALARLLINWGIKPDMMIGHSIGEYVAACISGVFSWQDALFLVAKRGELMQAAPRGAMMSIAASSSTLVDLLEEETGITVAAYNSSALTVVAGTHDNITRFHRKCVARDLSCKLLKTSHAFHSPLMDGVMEDFIQLFDGVEMRRPQIPFLSNVTGTHATFEELASPAYWGQHLRQAVNFKEGVDILLPYEDAVFVEVGPGRTLATFLNQHEGKTEDHIVINIVRHPKEVKNDVFQLLSALGQLWEVGVSPDWNNFYEGETRRKLSLPTYAFEQVSYPVDVDAFAMIAGMMSEKGDLDFEDKIGKLVQREAVFKSVDFVALEPLEDDQLDALERDLVLVWRQFFGKVNIGLDDDFFGLGGDSLKAMTLINRIQDRCGVEIPLATFFQYPTIRQIKSFVLEEQLKVEQGRGAVGAAGFPVQSEREYYPVSSAQKRLFFLHEFDKDSLAYNLPQFIQVKGELDAMALQNAFQEVINWQESLRTHFALKDQDPIQIVMDKVDFVVEHLGTPQQTIPDLIKDFVRPFDLSEAPLLRCALVELAEQDHVLFLDMHHIIGDGTSQKLLLDAVMSVYQKEPLPALRLQYKDFAAWQQSTEGQSVIDEQKGFWLSEFENTPPALQLPTDFPRPILKDYQGAAVEFALDIELTKQLRAVAKEHTCTTYMVLLSAFNILLSKLSGQEDITIGTPVSGRKSLDLERLVGMFINTICLRNYPLHDQSYRDFLLELKARTLLSFDHQDFPYESLVEVLQLERNTSNNPLFDVFFSYQKVVEMNRDISSLSFQPYLLPLDKAQFDLTLYAMEYKHHISLKFEYATALFKEATIERFAAYFQKIVAAVVENTCTTIGAINMLSRGEIDRQLMLNEETKTDYPSQETITSIFEKTVLEKGDRTALVFDGKDYSFKELNERSNQLARTLQAAGLTAGEVAGIIMDRSAEMIISILAILKLGSAYLPIDPSYPENRVRFMVEDSALRYLLATPAVIEQLKHWPEDLMIIDVTDAKISEQAKEDIGQSYLPTSQAYRIYTSGSTGKPKGVQITHRNVINFIYGVDQRIPFEEQDTMLSLTTVSFDIFVLETILPLLLGLKIVLAGSTDQKDFDSLTQLIVEENVSLIQITPSHLRFLISQPNMLSILEKVRVMMVGGEPFPPLLLEQLKNGFKGQIFNMYGPTETTVWSTIQDLSEADSIDIGKPINNTQIYILDDQQQLLPFGTVGEIYIGGDGVALGYWNRPALTDERFLPNPFAKQGKIYRTGDLGRWLPNGCLACLGRKDNQIKMRGFRIELGEIENQLLKFDGIDNAAVRLIQRGEDAFLVGYYLAAQKMDEMELKRFLGEQLPDYMVPWFYVQLDVMPMTPNGKLDRNALPEPNARLEQQFVAPANAIEEQLVTVWADVLDLTPSLISTDQSFFALGGHSLKAIALVNKLSAVFAIQVPLKEIFLKQTIQNIADYIITVQQVTLDCQTSDFAVEITL